MLGKYIVDKLFSSPEEQGKVARDLIIAGKKEGVDEMEIELSDNGGFDVNIPLDGVKIDVHIGKNQKTKIKVKYK